MTGVRHKQFLEGHKNCFRIKSEDQKPKILIANFGVKAKNKGHHHARNFTDAAVKTKKKKVFIAKSAKKQFLLSNFGVMTNISGVLGLKLLSSGTEPVTFFGEQSSLEGAQFSFEGAQAVIWGARSRNVPRGAGSRLGNEEYN